MTYDLTAPTVALERFSRELSRERCRFNLEMAGFTRQQADRLHFLQWLNIQRHDLEQNVEERQP